MDERGLGRYLDAANRTFDADIGVQRSMMAREQEIQLVLLSGEGIAVRAEAAFVEAHTIGDTLMQARLDSVFGPRTSNEFGESREIMLGSLGTFHLQHNTPALEGNRYSLDLIGTDKHKKRGPYPENRIKTVARIKSSAELIGTSPNMLAQAEEDLETLRLVCEAAGVDLRLLPERDAAADDQSLYAGRKNVEPGSL